MQGCYNMMWVAARRGIRRVINSGPHFTVAGPTYEHFDHAISPDVSPHPGTGLYPLTKSLGQEIWALLLETTCPSYGVSSRSCQGLVLAPALEKSGP